MRESAHAHGFSGGLALRPDKTLSTRTPIATLPPPARLVIAMQQHAGPPAEPAVVPGDIVGAGQTVGAARQRGAVAVHTALPGLVTAIEHRLVPSGTQLLSTQCVVIETRPADPSADTSAHAAWPRDRAGRLEAIRNGGIAGLGGATFPTDIKLGIDRPCETLILNGAECEPYISCDDMLMRERAQAIIAGGALMLELLGAARCIIAVERDKSAALSALGAALDANDDARFELVSLPTVYPAGGEKQLVESLLDIEIPRGCLPVDIGIVCQNVGTASALADLAERGRPLTSRIVTVTGRALESPQNIEVPLGTSIRDLLEYCGGLRSDACQLILGGNMMGYALPTDDMPVTKGTNCIIALSEAEAWAPSQGWACIRCGECANACPSRLQPQELLRRVRDERLAELDDLGLDDCIDCGCCDVVCPSHIPLTSIFDDAKRSLARYRDRRDRAAVAEARYAAHLERAAREARVREREQSQLTKPVMDDDASRRAAIDAAVERVRRRRERNSDTPSQ
jgi:electron transport complex protein RnfC